MDESYEESHMEGKEAEVEAEDEQQLRSLSQSPARNNVYAIPESEPVVESFETPVEPDPQAYALPPPPIYQTSFRSSFSEFARRDSRDVRPSRSCSPPAYSSISTPIATPEPPSFRAESKYHPYREALLLRGHKRGISCVRFSPNGRLIASCSADATVRIWSSSTGAHLNTLEGHLAGISTLSWAPDSRTLATGSDDKSIRLWDVKTGKPHTYPLIGHHNYIYSIAFNPKGNILVSGSYDEAVFVWDVRTRRILRQLPAHSDPVGGIDFCRDGTLIASCANDGLIRIWDTGTGQCLRTLVHEDNAAVTSVKFSPNGRFVLAWTLDACVRLWDYVEGRCLKTYQGHVNGQFSLTGAFGVHGGEELGYDERRIDAQEQRVIVPEKAFVVSGSEDGAIVAWDVISKEIVQKIEGAHEGVVLAVDTWNGEGAGQGRKMVSCGLDRTLRIWEPMAVKDKDEGLMEIKEEPQGFDAVNGDESAGSEDQMEGVEMTITNGHLDVPS